MLGVTLFGIFLTPVFYVAIRWLMARRAASPPPAPVHAEAIKEVHRDEVVA